MIQKKKLSDALAANVGVLEELMEVNKYLKYMGRYAFSDFNEATQRGIWEIYDIPLTHPHSPGFKFGILEVITSGRFVVQKAFPSGDDLAKVRYKNDLKVWTEWKTLTAK